MGKKLNLIIGTGALAMGAGAYHGYCDSKGIPVPKEDLITYGPIILNGISLSGNFIHSSFDAANDLPADPIAGLAFLLFLGGGVPIAGGIGATMGALETALGYGLGYLAGNLN